MARVLAVLTNWKRPDNVMQCVAAWGPQVQRLVIVDNSAAPYKTELADDVWRWTRNSGPPCRWAPALVDFDFDYALFADDDFLPKESAAEAMLEKAAELKGAFSTVGLFGRNLRNSKYEYGPWVYGEVYMTIRCHLVRRDLLVHALMYRERVLRLAPLLCSVHDDFMLCRGINMYTGFPCLAMPDMVERELSDREGACHRRPNHLQERQRFVEVDSEVRRTRG